MSKFLKFYIESVRTRATNILDKTPLMKMSGYPPINVSNLMDVPVFFKVISLLQDPELSF